MQHEVVEMQMQQMRAPLDGQGLQTAFLSEMQAVRLGISVTTKMKTTVIHHSADYDGIFCREIAKKFLGTEGVNYIGWNFGEPKIPMPSEGKVYILDLSPECLAFGPGDELRIIWIDHHATAIAKWPKEWAGYRIDGVAACRLAWQWFIRDWTEDGGTPLPEKQHFLDRKVCEPLAVRLAGEYDVWDHRGDGDLEFQFGLDAQPELDWDKLLCDRDGYRGDDAEQHVQAIIVDGQACMNCYAKRDADVMRERSFLVKWEGLAFLALNTAKCNSNTFNARDLPETGHDALMAFYWNGRAWTFSLYHAKHRMDLDLSAIAVKHGGGGHKGACGFTCDKLPFMA